MGRALREAAGLRVRQPLRALHVRSADPRALERLAMPFAAREVLEELNVKAFGSLAADDGQLVRLCAKANFRVLGKLLGPRMKAAAAQIETLGAEVLARLRAGGRHSLEIDGESIELDQSMLDIRVESRAEFPVETDGELVVWLDTQLDGDLVAEGLAREVVNRVNGLRKDLGLAVEERIHLRLSAAGPAADPDLARSLERHGKLISSETLAAQLDLVPSAEIHAWAQALGRATFDLGEGRLLDCALARVDGR
jgi:isoleucyl-tRNA synthetase